MARKGGLGSGVDSLLKGSAAQRLRRAEKQKAEQAVVSDGKSEAVGSTTQPDSATPNSTPANPAIPNSVSSDSVSPDSKFESAGSPALPEPGLASDKKEPNVTNTASVDSPSMHSVINPPPVSVDSPTSIASSVSAATHHEKRVEKNTIDVDGTEHSFQLVPIEKIRRGTYQPRQQFDKDALQELAESLKEQGMVQPVLVRPFAGGFELIAGERRWRAAQLAGLSAIPAIVREMEDQSVAAVSLIENIQRKDLNPIEEARALQRLQSEFGMTHEDVAEAIGRSRTSVTNLLRLLDLHEEVKVMVDKSELDMGHARALLGLETSQQLAAARVVVDKGLSVRVTEQLVRSHKNGTDKNKKKSVNTALDPDIAALQRQLGDKLGATVAISHNTGGGGRLEIKYNSLDELDGILQHFK